jgi:hypothetical protein
VDAVNEAKFVEVDEQAEGDVHELHLTHQLSLVDRENLRDDFELNEEAVIHQQIQAEGFLEGVSLVFNGNDKLLGGSDILEKQFPHQAFFVDRLNETRAFEAMDFDGRSDHLAAQLIGALEFRMHSVWKRKRFYRRKQR